jgi:D-psicose/D-tagatose/L-ribulose 3-epimerase
VLHMLKNLGYDAVELPIFNTGLDYGRWGKILDEIGLARTAVTIRGEGDNPISPDKANRLRGIDGNKKVLDCCAAAGCTTLVGPYHSAIGVFSGGACRQGKRDARRRGPQPVRMLSPQHARRLGQILP